MSLDRNEDYIEVRVPAGDVHLILGACGKTLAYRRLSWRDGVWGLVWDWKVHQDLVAAELRVEALTSALRAARGLLGPEDMKRVEDAYRIAQNA